MTEWLFTRQAWSVGGFILVTAIVIGVIFRNTALGNILGVVGLAVSVVGFVVTIWTVLDAREQIRQAGNRAEEAIHHAREEGRQTIAGIADQFLAADCAALLRSVEDLRQAAQDRKWPRAVYRCQECRFVAYRLAPHLRLADQERSELRRAADDFLLIQRFIENYRLDGQSGTLKPAALNSLDRTIGLLQQIQSRLYHEPLRPPEHE